MTARVVALHLKGAKGTPPRPVDSATGRVGGGFEGDRHVNKKTRSVVVVDRSTLEDLGLAPGDLREQVTIEGVRDVTTLEPGTLLRIGGVMLRVNGQCEPCTEIGLLNGVEDARVFRLSLLGRRGATCTVVTADGPVRVGDAVHVLQPAAS